MDRKYFKREQMKKILLLLMISYSFSFAFTPYWKSFNSYDSFISFMHSHNREPINENTSSSTKKFWTLPLGNSCAATGYSAYMVSDTLPYQWQAGSLTSNNAPSNCGYTSSQQHATESYTAPIPTCTTNEVLINNQCEVIGEQGSCTASNIRLSDGSCSTCSTSQYYDIDSGTCNEECDILTGTMQDSNGGCTDCSSYDTLSSRANCYCESIGSSYTSSSSVVILENINGIEYEFTKPYCDNTPVRVPVYIATDRCKTIKNPANMIPNGFIYKGIVKSDSSCKVFVLSDTNYIDSKTEPVTDTCPSNYDLFCFLKPLNENNVTDLNITFPDSDLIERNSTVFAPIENNISAFNSLAPEVLNNLLLQDLKNNLQDQTLKISDYHAWFKNKFGKWEPHTDATNQLNEQKLTTSAINNVKTSTDSVKDAINNQNSNLGGKLDTINNSINDLNLSATNDIDLNITNDLLSDILNWSESNSTNDSSGVMTYLNDTYTNFETQYNNVKGQINDAIDVINGKDLSSVLSSGNIVTTCPKTFVFDISSSISKDIEIDPCVVLSQSREYMYTFSYIGFSGMYISFLIGMIVRV